MHNNGFEHLSDIWKKADKVSLTQKVYSEEQIKKIKMKTSQDFSRSINKSIVFDFVQKGILIAGMLLLAWFYKTNTPMLITLIALIGLSAVFMYKEFDIRKKLHEIDDYSKELVEVLKLKLEFYREKLTSIKYMLAFSNALLVWVGSMFYFYSKYGYYKMEDVGDLIVTLLMVAMAFGISYLALTWQMKNNVLELEESLNDLDEQQADNLHKLLSKKRRNKVIVMVIAAIGVFLFVVLLVTYLRELY